MSERGGREGVGKKERSLDYLKELHHDILSHFFHGLNYGQAFSQDLKSGSPKFF